MTEQEAKLILDVRISRFDHANDVSEALEVAISALEEIQQYRAIGTVEELRELKDGSLSGIELANIWAALKKLKKYEAIGTVEELWEAMEKQIPKKADRKVLTEDLHIGRIVFKAGTKTYWCPNCNHAITGADKYCRWCGQAIDWER